MGVLPECSVLDEDQLLPKGRTIRKLCRQFMKFDTPIVKLSWLHVPLSSSQRNVKTNASCLPLFQSSCQAKHGDGPHPTLQQRVFRGTVGTKSLLFQSKSNQYYFPDVPHCTYFNSTPKK